MNVFGWNTITHWGEVQVLVPAAVWAGLWLLPTATGRALGWRWVVGVLLAVLITVASKIAFMGWGLGIASLNFTGFSGHAMFAAAILPMVATVLAPSANPGVRRAFGLLGLGLALLVGASRIAIGVHSVSEVVSGLALGMLASWPAQRWVPRWHSPVAAWVPGMVAVWLALAPVQVPSVQSHPRITQWALQLSGKAVPYTRQDLLHRALP
jgi:membrane-associated phospholipid phosphatase